MEKRGDMLYGGRAVLRGVEMKLGPGARIGPIGGKGAGLSGGERKLVALGACLVWRPDVLLLDEPELHLDAARRERLEGLIRAFEGPW